MKNDTIDPSSAHVQAVSAEPAFVEVDTVPASMVEVKGWELVSPVGENGEALVSDDVLAVKLGYKKADTLRQLIVRAIKSTDLEGVLVFRGPRKTKNRYGTSDDGKVVDRYWLNEAQAWMVCVLSPMPVAKMIRKELVRVYAAYKRGLLTPANSPPMTAANDTALALRDQRVAFLESAVEELKAAHAEESARHQSQVETLKLLLENGSDGPIGKVVATEHIRQPLHQLASLLYRLQSEPRRKTLKSIKTRLANQARAHVNFPSTTLGNDWSRLPKRQLLNVENWIFREMRRAEREAADLAKQAKALSKAARQMSMGFYFQKAG